MGGLKVSVMAAFRGICFEGSYWADYTEKRGQLRISQFLSRLPTQRERPFSKVLPWDHDSGNPDRYCLPRRLYRRG